MRFIVPWGLLSLWWCLEKKTCYYCCTIFHQDKQLCHKCHPCLPMVSFRPQKHTLHPATAAPPVSSCHSSIRLQFLCGFIISSPLFSALLHIVSIAQSISSPLSASFLFMCTSSAISPSSVRWIHAFTRGGFLSISQCYAALPICVAVRASVL